MANTLKELPAKTVVLIDTMAAANDVVTTSGDLIIGVNDKFNLGPTANISGATKQVWNAAVAGVEKVVSVTSVAGNKLSVRLRQPVRDAQGAGATVLEQVFTITESGTPGTDMAALKVLIDAARTANGGKFNLNANGVLSTTTVANDTLSYTAGSGDEVIHLSIEYLDGGSSATASATTPGEYAYNRTNEIENEGLDTDGITTATVFTRWSFFVGRNMGRNGATSDDVLHRVDIFADKDGANFVTFDGDLDTALGT